MGRAPVLSVIMATRDRPQLLPLGLGCFRRQLFEAFELIVVDDGERFPADEERLRAVGARLIRLPPGTPVGIKLNAGIELARGRLCAKVDDDDWYGPSFLSRLVAALDTAAQDFCRPSFAYVQPYTTFDLASWELRRIPAPSGAALLFAREDWERRPFRPVLRTEDTRFIEDQRAAGLAELRVNVADDFISIRHHGAGGGRSHTWTRFPNGTAVDESIARLRPHPRHPEDVLPADVLAAYRSLHWELIGYAGEERQRDSRTNPHDHAGSPGTSSC